MNTIKDNGQEPAKQVKYLSPVFAIPLALLVWYALPWVIALLTPHIGWVMRRPGVWNLLGLIPVLIGTAGLLWGIWVHSIQNAKGMEWVLDKSYLLTHGLYTYSRNPMYLFELILLLGWVTFYGSLFLLIIFVLACLTFNFYNIPMEERVLEAHFGEAYLAYKKRVPRWIGKIKR